MASGAGWFSPVSGNGTLVTNGQMTMAPMSSAFYPSMASSPFYKGNGQGPPTVPLSYMSNSQNQFVSTAMANPFSFTMSPLIMALAALVIGLVGLRYIHWR